MNTSKRGIKSIQNGILKINKNFIIGISTVIIVLILILFVMSKQPSESQKAVNAYLKMAENAKIQDKKVSPWNTVTVDYIWRLKDGTVFDTSVESVAKASWKYQTWRDYKQWLSFQVWAWQMIAGFDAWVVWMKLWETKTINIPFLQAYWAVDKKIILVMDYTKIPNAEQYKVWMQVMTEMWPIKVIKITKKEITFDANHELAGKDLIFDITIKDIK